ncbi:serine hydrolase [Ascidiimonas aurantiaca]|uniref:serine hydrolase n=1 Tax=Ascidiimonas aurantiaca TaxID=1685432 RepID=UPI0030EEE2E8
MYQKLTNIISLGSENFYVKYKVLVSLLLLSCFLVASAALADNIPNSTFAFSNGEMAYAYPITNITVDGNIADWPEELKKYSIEKRPIGKASDDPGDFQAYFKVGYNVSEKALYVMVMVTDDVYITDTRDTAGWNTQDILNFYINENHAPGGSGVDLYQFGKVFRKTNDYKASWDPSKKETNWDDVEIAYVQEGTATIYEIKVKLKNKITRNKAIGMDFVLVDKDIDDGKSSNAYVTWGEKLGKSSYPGRLGDVILAGSAVKTGTVSGKLVWKNKDSDKYPEYVRFTSVNTPGLWVNTRVDSTGNYRLDLPVGSYKITQPIEKITHKGDFHRIDIKNTTYTVEVKHEKAVLAPTIYLTTLQAPDLISDRGILHEFTPQKATMVDAFVENYMEYYQIPGVSLALIKEGKLIYHKTYGVRSTFTQEKVDHNTLFEAASISKPVFGFAVMRLAERGMIDIDKPLYQYLPFEAIAHDERYKLITARHVLSHQTGFPNWAYNNPDGKIDIKFTPGTGYGYSGEGFEYLKRVIQHITQKPIDETLSEEAIGIFNLENTFFQGNDYLARVKANGHYDGLASLKDMPESPGVASTMHTEARTFANFLIGISDRKGLKKETYDEMLKIQTVIPVDEEDPLPEGYENFFGLGLALKKTPLGKAFGHGGNNGDFRCLARMYEELDMGFVIFTNSNTGHYLHNDLEAFLVTGKL